VFDRDDRAGGRPVCLVDHAGESSTPMRCGEAAARAWAEARIRRRNNTSTSRRITSGSPMRLQAHAFDPTLLSGLVCREARHREPAVVCQQPPVVRSAQFGDSPAVTATPSTWLPQPWHCDAAGPDARTIGFRRRPRSVLARIEQAPAPPSAANQGSGPFGYVAAGPAAKARPASGEEQVPGHPRVETRIAARAGIKGWADS
jgi:hypothetical protein